jgi:hypothetical protein
MLRHLIEATFIRPRVRPYKTDNHYAALERYARADREINEIIMRESAAKPQRNKKRKEEPDFDRYFQEKREKRIKAAR